METPQETVQQDSALADLSEKQFQHQLDAQAVNDWLAIREIARSGNISLQNWKDARRRNNGEAFEKGEMAEMESDEMKINSPTTVHNNYPPAQTPPSNPAASLLKPLILAGASALLGGSGLGAAYFIAEAIKSRPVLQDTDTDSTIIQRFVDQDADWIKQ